MPSPPCASPKPPSSLTLPDADQFDSWQQGLRRAVLARVADFVAARCADELGACGVDVAGDILMKFVDGGKCSALDIHVLGLAVRRAGQ